MHRRHEDSERRRILAEWRRSGLGAHDFARCAGVSQATLYKWKREFGANPKRRRERGPAFVELAEPAEAIASSSVGSDDSGVELLLGDGVILRLAPGFDAVTLRRAVEALGTLGAHTPS